LEDRTIDAWIILKFIYMKWNGGMNWIYVTQDRDRWWAVVDAVTNIWFPQNAGIFLTR
jgi:hypothetical protein